MRVKRMCKLCGVPHTRVVARTETNYGPFMDWEIYHCPSIEPDEVGSDPVHHILYMGSGNINLSKDSAHRRGGDGGL